MLAHARSRKENSLARGQQETIHAPQPPTSSPPRTIPSIGIPRCRHGNRDFAIESTRVVRARRHHNRQSSIIPARTFANTVGSLLSSSPFSVPDVVLRVADVCGRFVACRRRAWCDAWSRSAPERRRTCRAPMAYRFRGVICDKGSMHAHVTDHDNADGRTRDGNVTRDSISAAMIALGNGCCGEWLKVSWKDIRRGMFGIGGGKVGW